MCLLMLSCCCAHRISVMVMFVCTAVAAAGSAILDSIECPFSVQDGASVLLQCNGPPTQYAFHFLTS